ncbi:tyrosine kinase receptor Cad96Ca-like [Montipora foliosa]|uniref:tyrosine kinase receptor Cad96Ca-like n=1 Tax=Montipora foliosa TaxID=591990 RepID=UPI0035F2067B
MKSMDVVADKWEISRDRIRLEEVIGSGAFGTVWRATLSRENGKPGIRFVAAKCFTPTSGEEGRKALMREIGLGKVLADSPVPNVAQFIGAVTTQIHPILIMEYLPCGDLLGYLRKSRGIADKYYHGEGEVAQLRTYDLVSFSKQIATAMGFLASRGIIHRDLAARNVLLDKNYVCKVTDFGLSYQNFKYGHGNAKKGCMPVKWTVPEILFGDASNLSTKSDVWSYGVVLYEIFTIGITSWRGAGKKILTCVQILKTFVKICFLSSKKSCTSDCWTNRNTMGQNTQWSRTSELQLNHAQRRNGQV